MRLIKLGLASIDTTVGAIRSNADKVLLFCRRALAENVSVLVFPEQTLAGYCPEDLVQWRAFVEAQWQQLERIAAASAEHDMVLAVGLTVALGSNLYNAAACIHRGQILGIVPKEKLPTYEIFYEARPLSHGTAGLRESVHGVPFGDLIFAFDFGILALDICEDIWSAEGPLRRRAYAGAELSLNLSASPFRVGIHDTRREMIATRAADHQITVAYVNLVGGNDGLVFDGGSVVAQNGRRVLEGPRFVEGLATVVVDLDRTRRLRTDNSTYRADRETFVRHGVSPEVVHAPTAGPDRSALVFPFPAHRNFFLPRDARPSSNLERFADDVLDALTLGLGSYFEKTGAFARFGVALSGGRDSLLCLLLAARWLERKHAELPESERRAVIADKLHAFYMPSRNSSQATLDAARQAALDVGASFQVSNIDDAFERELTACSAMLAPGEALTPLAVQNIQARVRAVRMWTWANSADGLFLQTSNMSEKAVGYTTIGGDMEGALSVVANLPKTVVNFLLDVLQERAPSEGIRLTLATPASAELAPDQEDEKDLMPFPVLDACLALYAGEKMSEPEVIEVLERMFPEHAGEQLRSWAGRFVRLFTTAIFKWVQTPLALHVGTLDLDRERALQLPVVQKHEW